MSVIKPLANLFCCGPKVAWMDEGRLSDSDNKKIHTCIHTCTNAYKQTTTNARTILKTTDEGRLLLMRSSNCLYQFILRPTLTCNYALFHIALLSCAICRWWDWNWECQLGVIPEAEWDAWMDKWITRPTLSLPPSVSILFSFPISLQALSLFF